MGAAMDAFGGSPSTRPASRGWCRPDWLLATVGVLVTRRKERRLDAAPLHEVFAGVRG